MNYQQAWDYLDSLQFHKIKLGLDAMRTFMARVDNPEQRLKVVHVAGTNGKGSVSITLLTLLAEAGYRVGLYTSPHLSSVRERFRIGDTFVSEEKFAELATRIRTVLGEEMITYFEFTTALAFLWFAEEDLDLVILETGLGGRLDATNIVTPLVSVITNISMDHEAYLGDTISQVAMEKAGIIKAGVPVVSAAKAGEGREEIRNVCAERGADLYLYGEDFSTTPASDGRWKWQPSPNFSPTSYSQLRCSMKGG
ncbi:MAG: Mur ligase family protein, partial [Thermodesulfobacteriota bacterium]